MSPWAVKCTGSPADGAADDDGGAVDGGGDDGAGDDGVPGLGRGAGSGGPGWQAESNRPRLSKQAQIPALPRFPRDLATIPHIIWLIRTV